MQQRNETDRRVGGPCEGCEAIYESDIAFEMLNWVDTLPEFENGSPQLEISGTIYQRDGKTPAAGVVLYIYHTNQAGIYATKGNEEGWARRHGYIRGWIKTNEKGQYKFFTTRPGSYPNSNNPQHIHPTIREMGKTEYYIDDFVFEDDPLLTNEHLKYARKRGGSGVLKPRLVNGRWIAERDIILGLNIPDYN